MHSYSSGAQGGSNCPCGVFHAHNTHCSYDAPSSVDCTLSLGPPSTTRRPSSDRPRLSSAFCWDFLQTTSSSNKNPKSTTNAVAGGGGDSALSRRCANCDTTSTPLWRNGPRGPKSLCNACGIRYKKEERRAAATSAASGGIVMMDAASHVAGYGYPNAWGAHHHHHHPGQKAHYMTAPAAAGNEFRFISDDVVSESSSADLQFLSSWRLNVTDRPTSQLVYDFTR